MPTVQLVLVKPVIVPVEPLTDTEFEPLVAVKDVPVKAPPLTAPVVPSMLTALVPLPAVIVPFVPSNLIWSATVDPKVTVGFNA